MGKLWLQCRLELELAVFQDVFLFLQNPPNQKGKATSPGLLVVLELEPFSLLCCLCSARWAGFEFWALE